MSRQAIPTLRERADPLLTLVIVLIVLTVYNLVVLTATLAVLVSQIY